MTDIPLCADFAASQPAIAAALAFAVLIGFALGLRWGRRGL